jgi:uncharacterized protein (DUF1499 family)
MKIAIALMIALTLAITIRFYFLGKESQQMNVKLSAPKDHLEPCESSDHCFHSLDLKEKHQEITLEKFLKIKSTMEKMGLNKEVALDNYLHYTAVSNIFGFVDDVEFFINKTTNELEFRSKSRVGKSDLGANKKRVQAILDQAMN